MLVVDLARAVDREAVEHRLLLLGAERVVAQHVVVVRELRKGSAGDARDHTQRRLGDAIHVPALELVADGNGRGNGKNAHEECPAEVRLFDRKLLPGLVFRAERRGRIFHDTVVWRHRHQR